MSFLDKVKSGFDKAKEGVSDFAQTTQIKFEISKLTDRKKDLFIEIGKHVYALRCDGQSVPEVEAQCAEIDALEQEIKKKGEEIVRLNTEPSTAPSASAVPSPSDPQKGAGV